MFYVILRSKEVNGRISILLVISSSSTGGFFRADFRGLAVEADADSSVDVYNKHTHKHTHTKKINIGNL